MSRGNGDGGTTICMYRQNIRSQRRFMEAILAPIQNLVWLCKLLRFSLLTSSFTKFDSSLLSVLDRKFPGDGLNLQTNHTLLLVKERTRNAKSA